MFHSKRISQQGYIPVHQVQSGYSSAKYSVNRNVPRVYPSAKIQSGYSSAKYSVKRNVPEQKNQSVRISQYKNPARVFECKVLSQKDGSTAKKKQSV
jgi:hypothetical protein